MYYDLPLFFVNAKIWKLWGFIEYKNYRKIGIFLIVTFVTNVCEIINFFYVWNNLTTLIMNLFMFAIILNSLVRIWIVVHKQHEFIKFMKLIEKWYKEIELSNDKTSMQILIHLPKRTRLISQFGLIFGLIGGIFTATYPFFLEQRAHPYSVHLYFIDALESPLYEIIYAVQSLFVMPFIVCTYIPFTNLFISWLIFGISLLQILYKKIEELPSSDDPNQLKRLKGLIIFHKRIIRFGQTLEQLVSFVCLLELLLFTMMLCVLLVCYLLVDNLMSKITTVIYIVSIFYVLFISYWHANEFSSESLNIANAVYNIDWTQSSLEVRKCVLIILVRCQTSLKISAGGMYPMTLEAFQALLNAAYTYFNMLRGLMAK